MLSVTCPECRRAFPIPADVVSVEDHQVIVALDRSDMYGHWQACAAINADFAWWERQLEGITDGTQD